MQIEDFLEQTAQRCPEKTALVVPDRRMSYAELDAACNRFARALIAMGVRRGDRVAIQLPNGIEAVVALLATLKAGAVFVMANATAKPAKLTYLLRDSRATTLILPAKALASMEHQWDAVPLLQRVIVTGQGSTGVSSPAIACEAFDELLWRHAGDVTAPAKRAIDLDLAALMYTSGSTGNAKGVMLTHLNVVSAVNAINAYLQNAPDDVILNVLPLSFGYGLDQLFLAFAAGATVVLERSFLYPRAVLARIEREQVTAFPLVPTMAAMLLRLDLTSFDLSRLRYITTAGAAMPPEHVRRLRAALPGTRIFLMYGQTECKRISYLAPEDVDLRPTSVGRGMPNQEVYLIDQQGRRLGPDSVGELVVRGAHVMRGYWGLPRETERALRPGLWPGEKVLHTGDLFRMDAQGYLYFVGRTDDIIKTRGEKVSPREVENVLCEHPHVVEAAVVGVPDDILGEAVKAFVVLRPGHAVTARQLQHHCAGRLEDFMVPRVVELRDELPKTDNGKINKRELCGAGR